MTGLATRFPEAVACMAYFPAALYRPCICAFIKILSLNIEHQRLSRTRLPARGVRATATIRSPQFYPISTVRRLADKTHRPQ
jgi:hypothetical protein